MPSPPWFRFYSETLTDRKIDRVCRASCSCKALVIGAWATILVLANDSPERGILLLTDDIPFTVEDLAGEFDVELEKAQSLIREFHRFAMLHTDETGAMHVTNWNGRQFTSDNSTERVQRFRAKKKALQDEHGNEDETLPGSYSNAPEQNRAETDNRTDTETEQTTTDTETAATAPDAAVAVLALKTFGMQSPETVMGETQLTPAQVVDTVRYAKQEKLGAGWVRKRLRANEHHKPRAPAKGWDTCPECWTHPCTCEETT
jgi:hypothetical protein